MEPNNRLLETAENAYNIGLTLTKRYSYEWVANSSLVHKNLPRPPHGTGVTGHTKMLKQNHDKKFLFELNVSTRYHFQLFPNIATHLIDFINNMVW